MVKTIINESVLHETKDLKAQTNLGLLGVRELDLTAALLLQRGKHHNSVHVQ